MSTQTDFTPSDGPHPGRHVHLLLGLSLVSLAVLGGCTIETHEGHWDDPHGQWNGGHPGGDQRCTTPSCRQQGPGRPPGGGSEADAGVTPPPPPASQPPTSQPPASQPPTADAGTPPTTNPTGGSVGAGDVCRINAQCGGGRCQAGTCQPRCTADGDCGTGHTCQGGFCQPSPAAGTQCLYSSACGEGRVCINGFCHQRCPTEAGPGAPSSCPHRADRCDRGVCRPDGRPVPQCGSNAQCAAGWMCVDAICRTACRDDSQCGADCSGTVCSRGFCVMPEELTPPACPAQPCGGTAGCPGVCR